MLTLLNCAILMMATDFQFATCLRHDDFKETERTFEKHLQTCFFNFFSQTGEALTGFGAEKKNLQHFMKIVYTTILELTNEDFCREYFKLFSQVEKKCKKSKELIICSVMF